MSELWLTAATGLALAAAFSAVAAFQQEQATYNAALYDKQIEGIAVFQERSLALKDSPIRIRARDKPDYHVLNRAAGPAACTNTTYRHALYAMKDI
jgi:hypothetical protein